MLKCLLTWYKEHPRVQTIYQPFGIFRIHNPTRVGVFFFLVGETTNLKSLSGAI
uniref:Uncharacterized protein n=1 Tax=Anguilla anguilla TaxID=7936 RepID=A0A0E9WG73_ANGAN